MIVHDIAQYLDKVPAFWGSKEAQEKAVCFFCAKPLCVPLIMWSGTPMIFFHPDCAQRFAGELLIDTISAKSGRTSPKEVRSTICQMIGATIAAALPKKVTDKEE